MDRSKEVEGQWKRYAPPDGPLMDLLVNYGGTPFSVKEGKSSKQLTAFYRQKFQNGVLFDLGAGTERSYTAMSEFAYLTGIKEYVAVDKYQNFSTLHSRYALQCLEMKYGKVDMKIDFVNADMLYFLANQAGNSASIAINGVDDLCITPFNYESAGYVDELMKQMARVLEPGGLVFGANSPHIKALDMFGLVPFCHIPGYGDLPGITETWFFTKAGNRINKIDS